MPWRIEKFWMTLRLGRGIARKAASALAWINTAVLPDDLILVDFPGYRRCFYSRSRCVPATGQESARNTTPY